MIRIRKYIGNKAFYRRLFIVAMPLLVQTLLTNCVNLVDNIMVGQLGTDQMSGVAIVNTLFMVYEVTMFGVMSGASIFGAQYWGNDDVRGHRQCFSFKLLYGMGIAIIGLLIFGLFDTTLVRLYLHEGSATGDPEATLYFARNYLHIIMISFPIFAISQAYSSSLREMGKTVLPMWAGISAILVNVVLNYILIFGKCGLPALGVAGAAAATVIARFIEFFIIIIVVHRNTVEYPFVLQRFSDGRVPFFLQARIIRTGAPLAVNELFWSGGMAMLNQCYSLRGLAVVAGVNITSTLSNVFNVFFIAIGGAVAIIVGQLLGAGKMEEAVDADNKLIAAAVGGCTVLGIILIITAPLFPRFYRTTDEVRQIATHLLRIHGLFIPLMGFMHTCYFTLRSGGKTIITLIFDSVFVWTVAVPLAFILTHFTALPIEAVYFWVLASELLKMLVGIYLLKKGAWINNIVK